MQTHKLTIGHTNPNPVRIQARKPSAFRAAGGLFFSGVALPVGHTAASKLELLVLAVPQMKVLVQGKEQL